MCVRMYVCMYVCTYVCMYVRMNYVCTYVLMDVHLNVKGFECIHTISADPIHVTGHNGVS